MNREEFFKTYNRLFETLDVEPLNVFDKVEKLKSNPNYNISDIDRNQKYVRIGHWEIAGKELHKILIDLGFKLENIEDEDRGRLYFYQVD